MTDLEECRTAIESTGDTITKDWSADTVNFVYGCSMEGSTLHYNTNSNGSPRMSGKPYCCCGDCSGNSTSYIIHVCLVKKIIWKITQRLNFCYEKVLLAPPAPRVGPLGGGELTPVLT